MKLEFYTDNPETSLKKTVFNIINNKDEINDLNNDIRDHHNNDLTDDIYNNINHNNVDQNLLNQNLVVARYWQRCKDYGDLFVSDLHCCDQCYCTYHLLGHYYDDL